MDIAPQILFSEHEFKKDDRYNVPKTKRDGKKHDRQKSRKKQKRKNKYEQWEMKGGYLKDYDEVSVTSSQENVNVFEKPKVNFITYDNGQNDFHAQYDDKYLKKFITQEKDKPLKSDKNERETKTNRDTNWYDNRMALRNAARKKLENELFEKIPLNNARWYFKRMQKREQCRAKGDNSTYRKYLQTKRSMNYKTKH